MDKYLETISEELLSGNRRALAKAITIVENGGKDASHLVSRLFSHTGRAYLLGVTGSPGVGKSTFVDALISVIRRQNLKVAVLAIDPTSPFTGGAILGDRIRMQEHTLDKNVFIRSMANRGHSGGIAIATFDAARMLDASGYDIVIIETVGVGQSELAVAQTADTTVLVLMPGSGDEIQAIKSGIMEIGDIFVVNKGDLPGAHKTATEILNSLELSTIKSDWKPPVLISTAETREGIPAVWEAICKHRAYLEESYQLDTRRKAKIEAELEDLIAWIARKNLKHSLKNSPQVKSVLAQIIKHETDPHSAACNLINEIFGNEKK